MTSTKINIGAHCGGLFAFWADKDRFAGSAFYFLHQDKVFAATANHCLQPTDERFQVVCEAGMFPLEVVCRDRDFDLCLFRAVEIPPGISARLSTEQDVPGNLTVHCYEYSATEAMSNGYDVNAATRLGNCVRMLNAEATFGKAGIRMLELSFPALKGASGAPIIEIRGAQLIVRGILVANVERHLHPAQIETVLNEANDILEERRYFLPQGVAVNAVHLSRMADQFLSTR